MSFACQMFAGVGAHTLLGTAAFPTFSMCPAGAQVFDTQYSSGTDCASRYVVRPAAVDYWDRPFSCPGFYSPSYAVMFETPFDDIDTSGGAASGSGGGAPGGASGTGGGTGGNGKPKGPKAVDFFSTKIEPMSLSGFPGEDTVHGVILEYNVKMLPKDDGSIGAIVDSTRAGASKLVRYGYRINQITLDMTGLDTQPSEAEAWNLIAEIERRYGNYSGQGAGIIRFVLACADGRSFACDVSVRMGQLERSERGAGATPFDGLDQGAMPSDLKVQGENARHSGRSGVVEGAQRIPLRVEKAKEGGIHIICEVPEVIDAGDYYFMFHLLTVALLTYTNVRRVVLDFSMSGVDLSYPLSQTWIVIEGLPADLFPEGREIELLLKISEKTQVLYALYRGRGGLRKTYIDPQSGRWEILEIRNDPEHPYDLLTRDIEGDPSRVEIHIDKQAERVSNRPLGAIISDVVGVIGRRRKLSELRFVVPAPEGGTTTLSRLTTQDMGEFEGTVTFRILYEGSMEEVAYRRRRSGSITWDANRKRLDFVDRPPLLNQPSERFSLEDFVRAEEKPADEAKGEETKAAPIEGDGSEEFAPLGLKDLFTMDVRELGGMRVGDLLRRRRRPPKGGEDGA